ncbi:MAG: ferritin-like domain-containing protein [Anaerolineales bacterium]
MPVMDNEMEQILQTAIQREIDAYNLYHSTAQKVERPEAKSILEELAGQEKGHRERLENLLEGEGFRTISRAQQQKVVDLKITDYLVESPLDADADLQEVLIVAGKREKASRDLYTALGKVAEDEDTKGLFEFLATQEAQHKKRVETLYEKVVYQWN